MQGSVLLQSKRPGPTQERHAATETKIAASRRDRVRDVPTASTSGMSSHVTMGTDLDHAPGPGPSRVAAEVRG